MVNSTTRKRKSRTPGNNPDNPNYALLREKMKRKRERRQVNRKASFKKPLAMPLTMVAGREQRRAYGRGKLLLMGGQQKVEVPLVTQVSGEKAYLQGVYKLANGEIVTLRTTTFLGKACLSYFVRRENHEERVVGFSDRLEDIAHEFLDDRRLNGTGLGIRAAVKKEKEYRAIGGKQPFFVADTVMPIFKKMHYESDLGMRWAMSKTGKANPNDDMQKNHVIEAIDPVTGKIKSFTFHIKRSRR